ISNNRSGKEAGLETERPHFEHDFLKTAEQVFVVGTSSQLLSVIVAPVASGVPSLKTNSALYYRYPELFSCALSYTAAQPCPSSLLLSRRIPSVYALLGWCHGAVAEP